MKENPPAAVEVARVLGRLRELGDAPVDAVWAAFGRADWPALFFLLDVGAGLPRLAGHETLARLPDGLWPALGETAADLVRVQRLVDHPVLPPGTELVERPPSVGAAAERLAGHHCVNVGLLFDADGCAALGAAVADLAATRAGSWGDVTPDQGPSLHAAMRRGLGSPAFRSLTGFDLDRHPYRLTLSLQSLEATGIGWHRDLYWPREWVGRDVFALFHALEDDEADRGGAFVYYLPWENRLHAFYRRRHDTTVLWNAADTERRILHAVTGYRGDDTRRHLVIAQCLRGAP